MIFDVKPAVVGHRGSGSGASRGYRENSLESFLAAAASGAPWVELDVRRTSDDELVVWHDRHTPAGLPVITRTASQLAAEGILGLTAVLAGLPGDIGVDMDVKTVLEDALDPAGRRTHALVAEALGVQKGTRPLLVSSFDPSVPLYLRNRASLAGEVGLGLITSERLPPDHGVAATVNLGLDAACLYVGSLGLDGDSAARAIEVAHLAGLEVMTWTRRRPKRCARLPPALTPCASTTFPARSPPWRHRAKPEWRGEDSRRRRRRRIAILAQRLAAEHRLERVDPLDRLQRIDPVDRVERVHPVDRLGVLDRLVLLRVLGRERSVSYVRAVVAVALGLAVTLRAVLHRRPGRSERRA